MRILLVGEVNPYNVDPKYALWPSPVNSAGWRLCHRILELSPGAYLREYDRANLCDGTWHLDAAKEKASVLRAGDQPLVLLGAKVCQAFMLEYLPFTTQTSLLGASKEITTLPHPSGRCHAWNSPDAAPKARRLLAEMKSRQ